VALGTLAAGQAHAVIVNVGGQDYDVTTFTGSYNANKSKFNLPSAGGLMPWWGSDTTSQAFAAAVGTAFGFPNPQGTGNSGLYFAWSFTPVQTSGFLFYNTFLPSTIINPALLFNLETAYSWAQVAPAPVPGPLHVLGACAAFGFSRKLRKRINSSKGDGSRAATL
jgi:hypothetical protein